MLLFAISPASYDGVAMRAMRVAAMLDMLPIAARYFRCLIYVEGHYVPCR